MQSGISASSDLQSAFKSLLSSSSQRGLLAGISTSPEELTALESIPSTSSDFSQDLSNLGPHIKENVALYVILKLGDAGARSGGDVGGNCVAITYVPDKAPVRQKMLFASSRLTLVRELGTEHFPETLFATLPSELTASGWAKHQAHTALDAPLTREEQDLVVLREQEATVSRGTTARHGHNSGASSVALPLDGTAREALEQLASGQNSVVVLSIDIPRETLVLDKTAPSGTSASELSSLITSDAPRYTFFTYEAGKTLFIYTCPSTSYKIKERMLYAASKNSVVNITAKEVGLTVDKKMEAGGPEDVDVKAVEEACGISGSQGGSGTATPTAGTMGSSGRGFARPKRPGRG